MRFTPICAALCSKARAKTLPGLRRVAALSAQPVTDNSRVYKKLLFKVVAFLTDKFWIIPGVMVCVGILGAIALIAVDRSGWLPESLLQGNWLYNGGGTGARTLLGAVVSSTIGVAGTVFSITIAALSLAAGQMGPRLLRNFTQDRGNQFTLGAFLGTFSYALMVLRSVRTEEEGVFVPHLSLSVSILLAFFCSRDITVYFHTNILFTVY